MEELMENIKVIKAELEFLIPELDKTSNKAAMRRCRKSSLNLTKIFKEYRALSNKQK
jgi:hypothetical protein